MFPILASRTNLRRGISERVQPQGAFGAELGPLFAMSCCFVDADDRLGSTRLRLRRRQTLPHITCNQPFTYTTYEGSLSLVSSRISGNTSGHDKRRRASYMGLDATTECMDP